MSETIGEIKILNLIEAAAHLREAHDLPVSVSALLRMNELGRGPDNLRKRRFDQLRFAEEDVDRWARYVKEDARWLNHLSWDPMTDSRDDTKPRALVAAPEDERAYRLQAQLEEFGFGRVVIGGTITALRRLDTERFDVVFVRLDRDSLEMSIALADALLAREVTVVFDNRDMRNVPGFMREMGPVVYEPEDPETLAFVLKRMPLSPKLTLGYLRDWPPTDIWPTCKYLGKGWCECNLWDPACFGDTQKELDWEFGEDGPPPYKDGTPREEV